MKKCTSCAKDLPQAALHCVFCGTKQPPVPASAPAKTVMGWQASDLLAEVQAPGERRALSAVATPGASMAGSSGYVPGASFQSSGARPPPVASGGYPSPGTGAVPPAYSPGPSANLGGVLSGASGYGAPGPAGSAPAGVARSGSAPAGAARSGSAPAGAAQSGYAPASAGQSGYGQPAIQPPYLASLTAARYGAPVEPYNAGLRAVLIGFGLLLLLASVAPMTMEPTLWFRWDALGHEGVSGLTKFRLVYVCAAALLALVIGLVPLATVPRAALTVVIGVVPVVLGLVVALKDAPEFHWQVPVGVLAAIALVTGLMLRHEYRAQLLPRVLTTIGSLCVVAIYAVPSGGEPLVMLLFDGIAAAEGKMKVIAIVNLLPLAFAVTALLCWVPSSSTAGAKPLAWFVILTAVIVGYASELVAGHLGDAIQAAPYQMLLSPWAGMPDEPSGGVPALAAAWVAFIGYGLATLLGKNLEHS